MILGLWETVIAILTTLGNGLLGALVLLKNSKDIKNRYFFWLAISISIWIISAYASEIFPLSNPALSLILSKVAITGSLFSVTFFFLFALYAFAKIPSKFSKLYSRLVIIISTALTVFIFLGKTILRGLVVYPNSEFDLSYGFLYYNFFIPYIAILLIVAIGRIIQKYRSFPKEEKEQFYYFLLGTGIFVLFNIVFNIIAPLVVHSDVYYRLGNYSSIFMLGFTAYAIIGKHLFNIKIILTEIIVAFIAILLFVDIVLSKSIVGYVWKSVLLSFFLIFGYLLIKSVYREIEYRNKLQIAYERLQRLDKAKSEFLSIASHQLRTPLTITKGYISMILEGAYGPISQAIKKPLKNIYHTNEKLIKLVRDLLNLSRIEAGRIQLNLEPTSLVALIKKIVEELNIEATKKGLYLKFQQPTTSTPKILLDKEKITQAISNIVDNAIKYTEKGGVNIKCSVEGSKYKIEISDTGAGMTKAETQSIFKSFSRGETGTKLWAQGAGLGLYIAKKFIDLHHGTIWVKSAGRNKGTTFYIELPINQKI